MSFKQPAIVVGIMLVVPFVYPRAVTDEPEPRPAKAASPIVVTQVAPDHYPGGNERNQMHVVANLAESSRVSIQIAPDATPSPVALRLTGPVKGLLLKDEGGSAVGDLDGLIASITAKASNDREKAEALFNFVVNDIKDWYYPAQGIDLTVEDLGVLIWNFGFGFCYDLGRLQAGLWARAGLRSRIVGWPQHTVAEVFYDDAWHLYDLQHRSFYLKEDGQVASFEELQANPKLFYQGLNEYGLDTIGYPPHHMEHWYGIAKPNFQDSNDGSHWKTEKDFRIDLREGELFEILYTEPGVIYHPDSWSQYYGEMTLRKDPPWPVQGRLTYKPTMYGLEAVWTPTQTPNGNPGFRIAMANPYIFTEGWIRVPQMKGFSKLWVKAFGQTHFVGRLVGGNAIFSRFIAGGNGFEVIVEPEGEGATAADFGLEKAELHARLQLSPIGLPSLKPGRNLWPVTFESGRTQFQLWYQEHAGDLAFTGFRTVPEHPKPGEDTVLVYTIQNKGSGRNGPTSLHVYNNVTAFLSETIEAVGVYTIPPLAPGASYELEVFWNANTRMTWYGQNPHVQLLDALIDQNKDAGEVSRKNNRRQDYVLLSREDGTLPELPGYGELPGGH